MTAGRENTSRGSQPGNGTYPPFLGLEPEHTGLEKSRVVILPVPYEATTSYGTGTRRGPLAILKASAQVELYDRHSGSEPATQTGFHTAAPVAPDPARPEQAPGLIADYALPFFQQKKFVLGLGGEHTVTVGLAGAAARMHPGLCLVQVDAHADLRDNYEGRSMSHACAARRALEQLGGPDSSELPQLIQIGIRNISAEGDLWRKSQGRRIHTVWAEDVASDPSRSWLSGLSGLIRDRRLYLSIDLDGLDCSVMPSTGTPEPGGLSWYDLTAIIEVLAGSAEIIGADIVELAPVAGNHAPDFLAARLGYQLCCAVTG